MVIEQFDSMLSSVIDQALGQRCSSIGYQFIETEKYDAKPTYKKFLGYRPVTLSLCPCLPSLSKQIIQSYDGLEHTAILIV